MANKCQKFLFNMSTMSPLVCILALVYWIEQDVPWIINIPTKKLQLSQHAVILLGIIILSGLFSLYSLAFVKICRQRLERIPIAVENVSPKDNWVIAVILSYALPVASFVFENSNLYISAVILLLLLLFLLVGNSVFPNPFVMLGGYHFYTITNIDGGGEVCLLSKREYINNRGSVSLVICPFNYLLIEERES